MKSASKLAARQIAAGIIYQDHRSPEFADDHLPLLLIHGAGGNHLHWPSEMRRLPQARVISVDLPGHGASPGGGEDSIDAYHERLLDLLDALELPAVVWGGHSMGGAIALAAALQSPQRVGGLLLVGSGGRLRVHPAILAHLAEGDGFEAGMAMIGERSYGPQTPPMLRSVGLSRMAEISPQVMLGDLRACDQFDVLDELEQITAPAQIICGSDDQMTPPKYSRFLAEALRRSRLDIIEGRGHMVMLEAPRQVAALVGAFLQSLRSGANAAL